jgi:hypothetical protein
LIKEFNIYQHPVKQARDERGRGYTWPIQQQSARISGTRRKACPDCRFLEQQKYV